MKKGIWWMQAGLAVVLTLFLIGVSVVGTLAFRPLYYGDIEELQIEEESGYSEEEIRQNYDALIDYNMAWEDETLVLPTIPMSENGRTHFAEVKDIFDVFKYLAVICGILGSLGIWYMQRKKMYLYLKMTAVVACGLPLVLGFFAAVCWQQLFTWFHKLVFDNEYWIFDYRKDPVILILPDTFFLHCALLIFGGVLLGAAVCQIAYLLLRWRSKRRIA